MDDFEKRRKLWKRQAPLILGKVSDRTFVALSKLYTYGYLVIPLSKVTDREFLYQRGIGPTVLAEIRRVIPRPPEHE